MHNVAQKQTIPAATLAAYWQSLAACEPYLHWRETYETWARQLDAVAQRKV